MGPARIAVIGVRMSQEICEILVQRVFVQDPVHCIYSQEIYETLVSQVFILDPARCVHNREICRMQV